MKLRYTFRRAERLHRDRDFQRVLSQGRRLVHPAIFIYMGPRHGRQEIRRLGLVTSRKVGGAVQRNLLKRHLREIFRLNKHRLVPGIDIVFMPRPGAAEFGYAQLCAIVLELLRKGHALKVQESEA